MSGPAAGLEALLRRARIVPVLTIRERAQAVPLARALCEGGLSVLEVTLRTPAALEAARAIMAEVPQAVVGLGTLTEPGDLERAAAVGARFAVSPGATPALLAAGAAAALPFMPGVATVSEAMQARAAGFTLLKLFPAEAAGGAALLQAVAGPLPDLAFCPTGGIDEANLARYLALPNVAAVAGSWLAPAAE
ncbi:MAG: bifunctional 4-hydroxy-2-oxoglutarate aldolase/2-dehydro-3-deoxy-phosphogluconate aldolase, partial [Rhodospirillaceae bacterium]|nr:bifunctional 4-hydroxy-2-oxoglutarate aldolase/2-dehydro-3-deoxy-phosphogluconate aldolase [Rhodospirillaceae bacterium]